MFFKEFKIIKIKHLNLSVFNNQLYLHPKSNFMRLKFYLKILLLIFSSFSFGSTYNDTLVKTNAPKRIDKFSQLDAKIALKEVFENTSNQVWMKPITSDIEKYNSPELNNIFFGNSTVNEEKFIDKIKKVFDSNSLKYVQNLASGELVKLPIGLKGMTNDGFKAEMVIVNAKVTPQYIELTAFARLETQFLNTHLYFAADKLKLSHDGGVIGDWKLYTLGNISLPQLGNKMLLTVLGGDVEKSNGQIRGDSYIEFDCNGFKSFSFKVDVRLGRTIVVPVDGTGNRIVYSNDLSFDREKAIGNKNYVGNEIKLQGSGWNDLLISLTLPNFEVTKLKDWSFNLKELVIDLSDTRNSTTVDKAFPEAYITYGLFPNGDKNTWRGFYAKEIQVTMPKQFNNLNSGAERTKIESTDLIIDNFGVSGTFAGYKVVDKGNASGWQFKLDYVGVKLEIGQIKSARIFGFIKPAATDSELQIQGTFNENIYTLQANVQKSALKMFRGHLVFQPNSWVKLEYDDNSDKFKASAHLSGSMAFSGTTKSNTNTQNTNSSSANQNNDSNNSQQVLDSLQNVMGTQVTNVGNYLSENFSFVGENNLQNAKEQLKKYADKGFDEIKSFTEKQVNSYTSDIKIRQAVEEYEANNPVNKEKEFYNFDGIVFQNLHLQSHQAPYIQVDYFGYPSTVEAKIGNFKLGFEDIHLFTPSVDEVGLAFKMKVNFMGGDNGNESYISGQAGLKIIGKLNNGEFKTYKFHKVDIDEIRIDVEKSGFSLKGGVRVFEDDSIYGKGFKGDLELELKRIDLKGMAKAMFAKKEFNYWFVDFQIDNNGSKGKFGLERVEGGLSYRMKRVDNNMMANINTSVFEPDISSGLSFRAGAKAKFGSSTSFKAKVFLEMQYNSNGGLNRIYFLGEGAMMSDNGSTDGDLKSTWASYNNIFSGSDATEMNQYLAQGNLLQISKRRHPISEVAKEGKVGLFISIEKDFVNDSFDGLFELYLKLDGFKGAGENNKFGMVHMYSSPSKSYLHVGTPLDKLGAVFKVGSYDIQVGAYFMTGDVIPSQTPPHPRVLQILGPNIMNDNRNLSLLNDAKGFAFGLNFSISMGFDVGWIYAYLEAGGGFDIMHRKLEGVSCSGRPGPVGNDGWYSMGQVYAYIYGEVGLKVDLWLTTIDVKILSFGVAAMLRGELPNPTYLDGYVGIYYNVLGGLVSGRFRYHAEIGEKCDFVGYTAPPLGISVIANVSPENEQNVDVFKKPQVAFNYGMLQPFRAEVQGNPKLVRLNLQKYELYDGSTLIPGEIEWLDNNTKANFISSEILPPQKDIVCKVVVGIEEKVGNSWVTLQNQGGASTESKEFTFKTGNAPEYIPLQNIKYTYPVIDANNFYPNEHKTVYVKLKQGQAYLFNGSVQNWVLKGELRQGDLIKSTTTLNYDVTKKKVNFTYDNISTNSNYQLKLMAYAPGNSTSSSSSSINVNQNTGTGTTLSTNDTSFTNQQTITNNTAQAQNNTNANKTFLEYNFVTSVHATFTDKMNSIQKTGDVFEILTADTHALHYQTASYEIFNISELVGSQYTDGKSLITTEAVSEDTYFNSYLNPLFYSKYPLDGSVFINQRNISDLGLVPVKAVDVPLYYRTLLETNASDITLKTRLPFRYNLPTFYRQDYGELKYKLINKFMYPTVNFEKYNLYKDLIDNLYVPISIGAYKIKIKYELNEGEFSSEVSKIYNRNF